MARTLTRRQALAPGRPAWPPPWSAGPGWSRPKCCPAATGPAGCWAPATSAACPRPPSPPGRSASPASPPRGGATGSATASPGRPGPASATGSVSACSCTPPPATSAGGIRPFALASADGRGSDWRPAPGDDPFGMLLDELLPLLSGLVCTPAPARWPSSAGRWAPPAPAAGRGRRDQGLPRRRLLAAPGPAQLRFVAGALGS